MNISRRNFALASIGAALFPTLEHTSRYISTFDFYNIFKENLSAITLGAYCARSDFYCSVRGREKLQEIFYFFYSKKQCEAQVISSKDISQLIRDDFAAGRTVYIEDWLISETETLLLGYAYIFWQTY